MAGNETWNPNIMFLGAGLVFGWTMCTFFGTYSCLQSSLYDTFHIQKIFYCENGFVFFTGIKFKI